MRWITASVFLGLLAWLLWVFNGFRNPAVAPQIFKIYSFFTFLYCLLIGTARTADCIGVERREGTLGLLFLTNLNSAEIVTGKLCSTALASVYGLMAIFPLMALPLLMGGITFEQFALMALGMLNGILFALAAGFLASVLCRRQFIAIALALGMTLGLGGGLMLGAAAADSYGPTQPLAKWLAVFSPFYSLFAADGAPLFGVNLFWESATTVAGVSFGWLGLTTFLLARTWRDRAKGRYGETGKRRKEEQKKRQTELPPLGMGAWRQSERAALRHRLLAINPIFWLASRQRVSAPVFMVIAVVLTMVTVYVAAPFFARTLGTTRGGPVLGHLFAWFWTGLTIHALVLYYAATAAAQRLAEDKQAGALELILSTPTTERTISRGLWRAYARRMLFPAVLAVLVHVFFLWQCMVMATIDPPGQLAPGTTPGELFWAVLLDKPIRGRTPDWQFGFMLRIALLSLLLLMATWLTLGWVARWLGLRMKHPGFAPIASLAVLFSPPILFFSLACYLADQWNLARMPERRFLPMMMWLAVAIFLGHCLILSAWAASRLRHNLRSVAMSRYQPLPAWRWRLPAWRNVRRLATATAVLAVVLVSLVAAYYGYQNWRSNRAWANFQNTLYQDGESLDLSPFLPKPVANEANLARSPAFLRLLRRTNRDTAALFDRMMPFDLSASDAQGNAILMDWNRQNQSVLRPFVTWTRQPSKTGSSTQRADEAAAILERLEPLTRELRQVAEAASSLPTFRTSTNRDSSAVFSPAQQSILLLERLHLLLQIRACASLELGRNPEAAEDLLAGLRLARLARQLPDIRSTRRVQGLLIRSLQPLWEGLGRHAWSEPQLAAVQQELAGFNLLSDYTNAVRRIVLAHIHVWRAIPDSGKAYIPVPSGDVGYVSQSAWRLQPRAWWFDNCIQLYNAGRNSIKRVDGVTGRIQPGMDWSDVEGLPLAPPSTELLQQPLWWGANPGALSFAQTSVNQAIIACALERFHLRSNAYPETLEQLVPAFLARIPHDAVSGRLMIYQRFADGFILRGVGPNATDDRNNSSSDDWLWTYSTNRPTAKR